MKAIEYYKPVKDAIDSGSETAFDAAISQMVLAMNAEVKDLSEKRHVSLDSGMFPIIKEMNDKWNKVAKLIERDYGEPMLAVDGFKKFWIKQIPELENHI